MRVPDVNRIGSLPYHVGLGEIIEERLQLLNMRQVGSLLGLHRLDEHALKQSELMNISFVGGLITRINWLHPLLQEIPADDMGNVIRMMILGLDPTDDLVVVEFCIIREIQDHLHGSLDGGDVLPQHVKPRLIVVNADIS